MGGGRGEPAWLLVVSADADRRMLLFRVVEQAGHRATVVDGAAAALALLEEEPFDAVLLDGSAVGDDAGELLHGIGTGGPPGAGHPPVLRVAAQPAGPLGTTGETEGGGVLTEPLVPAVVGACIETVVARASGSRPGLGQ